MSAAPTPPAVATWYPQLDGLGLPRALTNGIQQAYALIYSLRDTLHQLRSSTGGGGGGGGGVLAKYTQVAQANRNFLPMRIVAGAINDIPGCFMYFNRAGPFLVTGAFNVAIIGAGDADQLMECFLYQEGVQVNSHLTVAGPVGLHASDMTQWLVNSPSEMTNIKLSVYKPPAASGTSVVANAVLSAVYLGT